MKKTTEAFNNYFGSGNGSETKLKWENNNGDKEKMPPPRFAPVSVVLASSVCADFLSFLSLVTFTFVEGEKAKSFQTDD